MGWRCAVSSSGKTRPRSFDPEHDPEALVTLALGQTDTVQFAPKALTKMGYRLATVEPAPPPPPLRLQGRVDLDSESMVHIKPRFAGGRVVEIGKFEDGPPGEPKRTLRYGDHVHKDQVLAVVWSTEVGAKKSELVDAFRSCTRPKKFSSDSKVPSKARSLSARSSTPIATTSRRWST